MCKHMYNTFLMESGSFVTNINYLDFSYRTYDTETAARVKEIQTNEKRKDVLAVD